MLAAPGKEENSRLRAIALLKVKELGFVLTQIG